MFSVGTGVKLAAQVLAAILALVTLVRDWKYSDKRTKNHQRFTKCLLVGMVVCTLVGATSVAIDSYESEKTAKAVQKTLEEVTGGAGYVYFRFFVPDVPKDIPGQPKFPEIEQAIAIAVNAGEAPSFVLKGFYFKIQTYRVGHEDWPRGRVKDIQVHNGEGIPFAIDEMPKHSENFSVFQIDLSFRDTVSIDCEYSGRNGIFSQETIFKKIGPIWTQATRVFRLEDGKKMLLLKEVPAGFPMPKRVDGSDIWQ